MLVSFSTGRLRALALAGAFAIAATLALALPAAALTTTAPTPTPAAKPACIGSTAICNPFTPTDPNQPCGIDPVTGTACALGRISDVMGAIKAFASNPVGALGGFVLNALTGGNTDFAGQLIMGTPDFTTSTLAVTPKGASHPVTVLNDNAFHYLWSWFRNAALVILAIALVYRLIKQSIAEGKGAQGGAINVLIDIGPRLVIFPAMVASSFLVITGLARVSAQIGGQLFMEFASIAGAEVGGGGMFQEVLQATSQILKTALTPSGFIFMGIAGLALACMLLYVVMLSAMRFVMLAFMVVVAPVAIMCGAADTKNQVFQWWLTSTIGALLIPIIIGAVGGLTVVMSIVPGMTGTQGGSLASAVFMIGGLWFMGKAIHHATLGAFQGKHFSGMLAAAEVGMFAWTRPLGWHKSMASAVPGMGAGRGGGGGGRALQSAAGAIGGGGAPVVGGEAGGSTTAEAEAALAPRTPFRRAVETAVANGPLKDDVGAVAAAGGMSDAPLNDQVAFYLEQPYNKQKVFEGMHQEHMTAAGGFINPLDPKNTTEQINASFAVHHPELYGGGAALPAVAPIVAAPMVVRPRSPEQIQLIPDAGADV